MTITKEAQALRPEEGGANLLLQDAGAVHQAVAVQENSLRVILIGNAPERSGAFSFEKASGIIFTALK